MKVQIYLLNKTYIAQDLSTGLLAYGENEQVAEQKLMDLVKEYWEKRKVVVPINKEATKEKNQK